MRKDIKGVLIIFILLIIFCFISIIDACGQTIEKESDLEKYKVEKIYIIRDNATINLSSIQTKTIIISGDVSIKNCNIKNSTIIVEGDLYQKDKIVIDNSTLIVLGDWESNKVANQIIVTENGKSLLACFGDYDNGAHLTDSHTLLVYKGEYTLRQTDEKYVYVEGSNTYNDKNGEAAKKAKDAVNEYSSFLPIELVYFRAIQNNEGIKLYWETASETNNDYFTIEYSYDGINFYAVGVIDGAGTTSMVNDYSFIWEPEKSALMYFRLKQTDYNGEYSYSNVISVQYNKENKGVYFQNGKIMYSGRKLRI